jgi:hypothetical protein
MGVVPHVLSAWEGLLPKSNLVHWVTLSSEFAIWNSRLALIVP